MYSRRSRRGGGFPLMLLGFQIFRTLSQSSFFPPVTLGVVAVNIAAFLRPEFSGRYRYRWIWPSIEEICINAGSVWYYKEWKRLILSPFFHLDEWHIYYNMASFLWKGISLEAHFGSGYFLYVILVFSVLSNITYCGIQYILSEFYLDTSYVWQCAAGFSGVIFALKVVTTYGMPPHTSYIMGFIPIPSRHAAWAELILISILVPRASFVGHLAGILVGVAYVKGPLKAIMDIPIAIISPARRQQFHGSGQSGYRGRERDVQRESVSPRQATANQEDDDGIQEAIRRSLRDRDSHWPPAYNPDHTEEPQELPLEEEPARTSRESHSNTDQEPSTTLEAPSSTSSDHLHRLRSARLAKLNKTKK